MQKNGKKKFLPNIKLNSLNKRKLISGIKKLIPKWAKNIIIGNKTFNKYYQKLRKKLIKRKKSPRVYIKKGIGRMEFFAILNSRNVQYVLLRWWQDLPLIPEGEDMDILVLDEHRNLLNDLVDHFDNGTGLKCDIYTINGSNYGSHKSLPYFQINLAYKLIQDRILYRGAFVPSPFSYFASLAYHAIFHKGYESGLSGFDKTQLEVEHDYTSVLSTERNKLGLKVAITVNGLFDWLDEHDFLPADDTLSKLAEIKPELAVFQKSLYSDIRGGDLIVYVIRERMLEDDLLAYFKDFLKKEYLFDILDIKVLDAEEQELCRKKIRGGKWDKGPYTFSGGPPVALLLAFDHNPLPLSDLELKLQPRMTNSHNLHAKYEFRDIIANLKLRDGDFNGVHSSDNEQDAWSYISLLGEDYKQKIIVEVENKRNNVQRVAIHQKSFIQ